MEPDPKPGDERSAGGGGLSDQESKTLSDLRGADPDVVVTVCGHADETCPAFPGRLRKLHAGFDVPPRLAAGERDRERGLDVYRRVRDELRAFVERLPAVLAGPTASLESPPTASPEDLPEESS